MLGLDGTYGTSTGRVRQNGKELRKQQENGEIRDLEWEHVEGQREGLHRPGTRHPGLGGRNVVQGRGRGHKALEDLIFTKGQGEMIRDFEYIDLFYYLLTDSKTLNLYPVRY